MIQIKSKNLKSALFLITALLALTNADDICDSLQGSGGTITKVKLDGELIKVAKFKDSAILSEVRKCLQETEGITEKEYFFKEDGTVIPKTQEDKVIVSEVIHWQESSNFFSSFYEMTLKRSTQYNLVSVSSDDIYTVNFFGDQSLKKLRINEDLRESIQFMYDYHPIDACDEDIFTIADVALSNGTIFIFDLDIDQFYNEPTEEDLSVAELDIFGNPVGSQFDLGKDDAFQNFTILIGCFYSYGNICESIESETLVPDLNEKGFKVKIVLYEDEFYNQIEYYNQAWILSGQSFVKGEQDKFVENVINFYNSGKGLYIFANYDPYVVHANLILNSLNFGTNDSGDDVEIQLDKQYYGFSNLVVGEGDDAGEFVAHEITVGINKLFEGDYKCAPVTEQGEIATELGNLKTLAMSSDGVPVIMYSTSRQTGRLVIDCDLSRLSSLFWDTTAGTSRYVTNSAAWLAFNDMNDSDGFEESQSLFDHDTFQLYSEVDMETVQQTIISSDSNNNTLLMGGVLISIAIGMGLYFARKMKKTSGQDFIRTI